MDWKNISFEEFETLFIKPSDVNMESILNSADTPTKKKWNDWINAQKLNYDNRKSDNENKRKRLDDDITFDSALKDSIERNLLFIKTKSKQSRNCDLMARSSIIMNDHKGINGLNRTILNECVKPNNDTP